MLIPQVGAGYDMAQGAVRVAGGAMQSMQYGPGAAAAVQLQPRRFNPMYNMQYTNPMQQNPYMYASSRTTRSTRRTRPARRSCRRGCSRATSSRTDAAVRHAANMYRCRTTTRSWVAVRLRGNPYMSNPAMTSPMFGTPQDGIAGAGRAMLGAVKMVPVLGNLINGFDFIRDIGHLGRAMRGDRRSRS